MDAGELSEYNITLISIKNLYSRLLSPLPWPRTQRQRPGNWGQINDPLSFLSLVCASQPSLWWLSYWHQRVFSVWPAGTNQNLERARNSTSIGSCDPAASIGRDREGVGEMILLALKEGESE